MGIWVLVALAVAFAIAVTYFETKRRDALARVAAQLGFAFTRGLHRLPEELDTAGFYLFTQGPPNIENRMQGKRDDYEIALFGFSYDAPQGEEGRRDLLVGDDGQIERRHQTLVWLRAAGDRLPDFDLSPTRQAIRRAGARFGLRRFTFDGREEFRDLYYLFGRDERAIRGLFTPAVLDAFVQQPGWFLEGRGDQWLVYRIGTRVSPEEIPGFLDQAIGLVDVLRARGG